MDRGLGAPRPHGPMLDMARPRKSPMAKSTAQEMVIYDIEVM